jgi:hypothetical protein
MDYLKKTVMRRAMDLFLLNHILVGKTAARRRPPGCRIDGRFFSVVISFAVMWGAFTPGFPVTDLPFRIAMDETGFGARLWSTSQAARTATIHSSSIAVWQVYDTNAYLKYKENIDSLVALFDRAVPIVVKDLGVSVPLPAQVYIDSGDCCGGWASINAVGFRIENFNSQAVFPNCDGFTGPDWTRGVIIGEFANHASAVGSSGCQPRDWWVDDIWNFPDMVVVDVLAEALDSTAARYWEAHMDCSDLMNKPLYKAFKDVRLRHGWSAYQNAFKAIREDSISFCSHFTNPSALLTNYTLAYLSLGAQENVAEAFRSAGAAGADSAMVTRILSARKSLHDCPDQAGGNAARQAYLSGNYQAVTVCSPYTFCRFGNFGLFPREKSTARGVMSVTDISGRVVKKYSFDGGSYERSFWAVWTGKNGHAIPDKTGVYIIRISLDNQSFVKKLVVLK